METIAYTPLPTEQQDVEYGYGPDSMLDPAVAPGQQLGFTVDDPPQFPGTRRRVWLHIPAGVRGDRPVACTLVLDGSWYLDPAGPFRAGVVLDNLVARQAVPPMVGIFVDPGVFPADGQHPERKNRNGEFDAAGGEFGDFLAATVLPLVHAQVQLSTDPLDRAVCGGSSGGNAAFTAAWHRPDVFGRVVSLGGSFAQMPGGNPYPALIASSEPKPLKVLLTAAHRDLGWNQPRGNWFAENLKTAAALAEAGYDMRLVLREGGHSMVNGGAVLPDALRWVWA